MEHYTEVYSKDNNTWDFETNNHKKFVGGLFVMPNLSGGYHGIEIQWWDFYNTGKDVLLVSEDNTVKNEFKRVYPDWNIKTTECFNDDTDIKADMCDLINPIKDKFDLIINQATIEHVYNPFQVMKNLFDSLNKNGILITHTHPPSYKYHQYPRDYFRFMKDWWHDLPKYVGDVELLELYMHENRHVFTCYRKL